MLTTDYAQGEAHAPAYDATGYKFSDGKPDKWSRNNAISREIETGREANGNLAIPAPSIGDVLQSLTRDSDVLDYGGFENWASELGYDEDSRAAESVYRACLDIATKLRAGLGASLLGEI